MIWSMTGEIHSEDAVIQRLANILNLSSEVPYFYAKRVPPDVRRDATDREVEARLMESFRQVIDRGVEERVNFEDDR